MIRGGCHVLHRLQYDMPVKVEFVRSVVWLDASPAIRGGDESEDGKDGVSLRYLNVIQVVSCLQVEWAILSNYQYLLLEPVFS